MTINSQPLDVVLGLLGDELDSLQDVGYVVDAPLLDVQDLRGPVQIHHAIGRLGQQVEEALGGQVQGGVVPRLLRRASRNWKSSEKHAALNLLHKQNTHPGGKQVILRLQL